MTELRMGPWSQTVGPGESASHSPCDLGQITYAPGHSSFFFNCAPRPVITLTQRVAIRCKFNN